MFFASTPIPHVGLWMCRVFLPRCGVVLCLWWALLYLEFSGDEEASGFGLNGYVLWLQ